MPRGVVGEAGTGAAGVVAMSISGWLCDYQLQIQR